MPDLSHAPDRIDLVALSLLPIWWWRSVGEALRAGERPGIIFDRLLAERSPDQPNKPAALRAHATAALGRAVEHDLVPID